MDSGTDNGRRGLSRRLVLISAGTLAAVLVVYLGLAVFVRSYIDPAGLADSLEPRFAASINRPVTVDRAQLRVFPRPWLRLTGVGIGNLGSFAGLPLATVDEIHLSPRLLPLLQRRIEIGRVTLVSPHLLLQVDESGRTNFGDFVPADREAGDGHEGPSLEFVVRKFEARNGRIGYRDRGRGRLVQVDGILLGGSLSRGAAGGLAIDFAAETDSVLLELPPLLPEGRRRLRVKAELSATAEPGFRTLEIESGTLSLNEMRLSVKGRIDSVLASVRPLDVQLSAERFPLADVVASLSDSTRARFPYRVRGEVDMHLGLAGRLGPGVRPEVKGLISVRDADVRTRAGTPAAERLAGEIVLDSGRAELVRFEGTVLGGPLDATGTLELDSSLTFKAFVSMRPELALTDRVLSDVSPSRESLRLSGDLIIESELRGRLHEPGATRASGRVQLRDVQMVGPRPVNRIAVPEGRLELTSDGASWQGLTLTVGSFEVSSSGSLGDLFSGLAAHEGDGSASAPTLDATVRAVRLDFDALRSSPESEIGYGRLAFARLGRRTLDGHSAEDLARRRSLARPDRLPLAGEVRFAFDSLFSGPYRLGSVTGRLLMRPDRFEVTDLAFEAYGGSGTGRLVAELGEREAEPFRLELSVRNVRAEGFLADNSPLGSLVIGRMSLGAVMEGTLDELLLPVDVDLSGDGLMEVLEGRLAQAPITEGMLSLLGAGGPEGLQFSRWTTPFTIRDGAIHLSRGSFGGRKLSFDLAGVVGFGGALDLGLVVRPDTSWIRKEAETGGRAAAVFTAYLEEGAPAEIGVLVGGTAARPEFSLDPSIASRAARNALEEAAGEAIRSELEEVRGRGLDILRRLSGGSDSAAVDLDTLPGEDDEGGADSTAAAAGENGPG